MVSSFLICLIIAAVLTSSIATIFKSRFFTHSIYSQSHWLHENRISRFGGLAIVIALSIYAWLFNSEKFSELQLILISASPLFIAGMLEDFSVHISPFLRIFAGLFGSLIFIYTTGIYLVDVDIPLFGTLPLKPIAGVVITIMIISTMPHAFNLTDGLNGLSSGFGALAAMVMAFISYDLGDTDHFISSLALLGAILGFWIFNISAGSVFLGDCGAYLIGHLIALLGISICETNPAVSIWVMVLIVAYPLVELMVTIFRRFLGQVSIMAPDTKHFHHLLFLKITGFVTFKKVHANSLSAIIILVGCGPFYILATQYYFSTLACGLFFLFFTLYYLSMRKWLLY